MEFYLRVKYSGGDKTIIGASADVVFAGDLETGPDVVMSFRTAHARAYARSFFSLDIIRITN